MNKYILEPLDVSMSTRCDVEFLPGVVAVIDQYRITLFPTDIFISLQVDNKGVFETHVLTRIKEEK